MSDKFLNGAGLGALRTWILGKLGLKQDTLVSGTNIKTVNNESILGSGNVSIDAPDIFVATYDVTPWGDVYHALNDGKSLIVRDIPLGDRPNDDMLVYQWEYDSNSRELYLRGTIDLTVCTLSLTTAGVWDIDGEQDLIPMADDMIAGLICTNSDESITLKSNGQLDVGGRLGAFPTTTGIFHSKDREPRSVKDFSFLITDAKGMNLDAPRDFALATGINLSLTGSHAAGSTTYTVTNNYANRIACAVLANGGYVSQTEAYSKENLIVPVTSVKINGVAYTPTSAANDSTKPITITTETSGNPTAAVTQLRVFGGITGGFCSEYIGQCVGGSVGASLVIGQRVYSSANVNCIVAADVYNTGNGNAIFGRQHISRKNRGFLAGTGHDTTNAGSESVAAVGEWSDLTSTETLFAVGDGTSHTARSNAFEVRDQAIVLKSPNGTKYKITVSNTGTLTTTKIT